MKWRRDRQIASWCRKILTVYRLSKMAAKPEDNNPSNSAKRDTNSMATIEGFNLEWARGAWIIFCQTRFYRWPINSEYVRQVANLSSLFSTHQSPNQHILWGTGRSPREVAISETDAHCPSSLLVRPGCLGRWLYASSFDWGRRNIFARSTSGDTL